MNLPTFRCEQLKCDLSPEACVKRQDFREKVRGTGEIRRPRSHAMCDPAACEPGRKNREFVDEAQRAEAGIPLEALDAENLDELFDSFDLAPTTTAKEPLPEPLPEAETPTATEPEGAEPQVEPIPEPAPVPAPATPPSAMPADKEEPVAKIAKLCACGATIRKDSTHEKCSTCRDAEKGEPRKCNCGATIRRDSSDGKCMDCRAGKEPAPAPTKKAPKAKPAAAKASVVPPPLVVGDAGWATMLQARIEKLSNDDLAQLLQFVRGLARERLRGADALRAAVEA